MKPFDVQTPNSPESRRVEKTRKTTRTGVFCGRVLKKGKDDEGEVANGLSLKRPPLNWYIVPSGFYRATKHNKSCSQGGKRKAVRASDEEGSKQ